MTCSPTTAQAWYRSNTMFIQLGTLLSLGDTADAPLTDELTGAVIVDAAVTARLLDRADAEVSGETWPLTITHVAGGVYRGAASHLVAVALGVGYVVEITATKAGSQAVWRVPVTAQERAA